VVAVHHHDINGSPDAVFSSTKNRASAEKFRREPRPDRHPTIGSIELASPTEILHRRWR
jgi:hypothetical protein